MVFIIWQTNKKTRGLMSIHSNYDSALTTLKLQVEGGRVREDIKTVWSKDEIGYGIIKASGERADGVTYHITQHNVEG